MEDPNELTLSFTGTSDASASQFAKALQHELAQLDETVTPRLVRSSNDAMNMGDMVQLIVTSGAAGAIAAGLGSFIKRHSGAKIIIKTKDGTVIGEMLDSRDAARIAEAAFAKVKQ